MSTDKETQPTTSRQKYMREYYQENKRRILDKRKKRYQTDPEYRESLNNSRRKGRLFNNEPQVIQSAGIDTEASEKEVEVAHLCKMRVLDPRDRSRSAVCRMYTLAGTALMIGVDKDRLSHWLYKDRLPQPRYRNASNWRLYTEYEVEALKRCFASHRRWCRANNYIFRLNGKLQESVAEKFKTLPGGVDPKAYVVTNDL